MKKTMMVGLLVLAVAMVMSGCWRKKTCDCTIRTGCSTAQAVVYGRDSVLDAAIICADSSVDADLSYKQELRAFEEKSSALGANVVVRMIDTNIKEERVENLNVGDLRGYQNRGYECMCYE